MDLDFISLVLVNFDIELLFRIVLLFLLPFSIYVVSFYWKGSM
jgi:hypothetical protein